ncbi:hypothetical protein VL06_04835 [Rossellomorea marisflavi]|nr:hypothetical protein VL03_13665 [Rossellomorea marisflavi]KML07239.1 hypothetical protein VL06_04835 [Rossellomorea marisflavi]
MVPVILSGLVDPVIPAVPVDPPILEVPVVPEVSITSKYNLYGHCMLRIMECMDEWTKSCPMTVLFYFSIVVIGDIDENYAFGRMAIDSQSKSVTPLHHLLIHHN